LRNSFLLINQTQKERIGKLSFTVKDFFKPGEALVNELVNRESDRQLLLTNEKDQLQSYYDHLQQVVNKIDSSLGEHVKALQKKASEKIIALEKKMLRAEKRKFEAQQRQINKLKQELFPKDNLQERVDNFSIFYAKYGQDWLKQLCSHSLTIQQEFGILQLS